MIEIKFKDLVQAVENKAKEMKWFLDSQTGKMILHSEEVDLGDDGAFADQLDLFPDRYFEIERIPDKVTYRFMIDFVNEVTDTRAKVDIAQTFSQKRPMRQFLATVARYPKVQRSWQKYLAIRQWETVRDMLNRSGVEATVAGLP